MTALTAAQPTSRRLALLVANGTFPAASAAELPPLPGAATDARQLARVLADPEIGAFTVQEPLVDRIRNDVESAIFRFFREAQPDDLLFFFYAGHGKREDNDLYLCTRDTVDGALAGRAVALDTLHKAVERSRARQIVVMLDCCFSGAALDVFAPRGAAVDQAISQLSRRAGTHVLCSALPYEAAFESADAATGEVGGEYTRLVVQGLETGEADGNKDGVISPPELQEWVAARAVRSRPVSSALRLEGDSTVLARNKAKAEADRRKAEAEQKADEERTRKKALALLTQWWGADLVPDAVYRAARRSLEEEPGDKLAQTDGRRRVCAAFGDAASSQRVDA